MKNVKVEQFNTLKPLPFMKSLNFYILHLLFYI